MKLDTTAGWSKCEMTDECARDAVGTVRDPLPRSRGDVPTCREHAGRYAIWGFGQPSPYRDRKARV